MWIYGPILLFACFISYAQLQQQPPKCKWDVTNCGHGEVRCSPEESVLLDAKKHPLGDQCFAIKDDDNLDFSNYEIKVDMLSLESDEGVNTGNLGVIFNFADELSYDFVYLEVHNSSIGRLTSGYRLDEEYHVDEHVILNGHIDGTMFHSLRLVIDNNSLQSTKVFLDTGLIGSFQEHFVPRLKGGVFVGTKSGSVGLFQKFNIKGCKKFNQEGKCRDVCTDEGLTNVTRRNIMENNGWMFNVTHSNQVYDGNCGTKTWYGFWSGTSVGAVAAVFKGSGTATLVFGNCHPGGLVKVYLNDLVLKTATSMVQDLSVTFAYSKGDVLTLTEDLAIIKLNSLTLKC